MFICFWLTIIMVAWIQQQELQEATVGLHRSIHKHEASWGLESWLSSLEHLFFQMAGVQSPAPTWWLMAILNSSSEGSDVLF